MTTTPTTQDRVREYYGQRLESSRDLKTGACCSSDALPAYLRPLLLDLDAEILNRFYGCGSPIPDALDGCTVLDLGCGTGRDSYLCSKLVGANGHVIGVDMTDEQLAVAQRHVESQAQAFGYDEPNTDFRRGEIENLAAAGITDNSIDVAISNCVLNLCADKQKAFGEILRVLKPGGELYFSDVFADRRIPAELMNDTELVGECLAGAMYVEDFRRLMATLGVHDYRVMRTTRTDIHDDTIREKIGFVNFYSITIRAFKLDLEDRCEDFGQVAYYNGTIPQRPHSFALDDHHEFITDKPMLVCGNTAAMLSETRFGPHFRIAGDKTKHFGLFDCKSPRLPLDGSEATTTGCC